MELLEAQKNNPELSGEEQESPGAQEMQEVRSCLGKEMVLFRSKCNEQLL